MEKIDTNSTETNNYNNNNNTAAVAVSEAETTIARVEEFFTATGTGTDGANPEVEIDKEILPDSEEEEEQNNMPVRVSPILVSASKGVSQDSPLPVSRFEAGTGTGRNGHEASTSAFRPAGTVSGFKRNFSLTGFDLNSPADEGDEDGAGTGTGTDDVVVPPHRDSSADASSQRIKRLKFELNRRSSSEEAVPEPINQRSQSLRPSSSLNHQTLTRGVDQKRSHSAPPSLSLYHQSLTRGFDLNEEPQPFDDNTNSVQPASPAPVPVPVPVPEPTPKSRSRSGRCSYHEYEPCKSENSVSSPIIQQPASPDPVPVPVQEDGLPRALDFYMDGEKVDIAEKSNWSVPGSPSYSSDEFLWGSS